MQKKNMFFFIAERNIATPYSAPSGRRTFSRSKKVDIVELNHYFYAKSNQSHLPFNYELKLSVLACSNMALANSLFPESLPFSQS